MAHTLLSEGVRSKQEATAGNRTGHRTVLSPACYQASAPGSLMLFGEHAVLAGKRALCMAINQRIKATLFPRNDTVIRLKSSLGEYEGKLEDITFFEGEKIGNAPFHFILTAISLYRDKLKTGFELVIDSDFSSRLGLGSSAAHVVAALRVLAQYTGDAAQLTRLEPLSDPDHCDVKNTLFKQALAVMLAVQGKGSGADIAASVFGGIVLYRKDPLLIKVHSEMLPLVVAYVGYKTPTPEVIQRVHDRFQDSSYLLECLFDAMETCTETALQAMQEQDWAGLGHCMNVAHGLMNALGVSDLALEKAVHTLRAQEGILGAKISGAGLGDCVIGVGEISNRDTLDTLLDIESSDLGVEDA